MPTPRALPLLPLLLPAAVASAQVPTLALSAPQARLEQEFTRVTAVRELTDGRLVVLDRFANQLMLVDATLGSARQIGREGQGPGEFFNPTALVPLTGDSTGVVDQSSRALKVILPDGRPGGLLTHPGGAPCGAPGDTLTRRLVSAISDARGRFYALAANLRTRPDGTLEQTDASAIERWGAGCGRDTLGYIPRRIDANARILPGGALVAPATMNIAPYATGIQWIPAPDGRVAVVHPDPYRVDVIDAPGQLRRGTPVSYSPVRLTEAHRRRWLEEFRRPAPVIVANRGGGTTRQMMAPPFREPTDWPRELPPFLHGALSMGHDGRLWVLRTTIDLDRPEFDVFDATGRLTQRVVLPPRTRLVGHGRGVVYLVRLDGDDLEYLERHPLPG